ncbi:hypothetical protein [Rufibacter hautae]|nr:hypothetical protein [Rufibacter hautae]
MADFNDALSENKPEEIRLQHAWRLKSTKVFKALKFEMQVKVNEREY